MPGASSEREGAVALEPRRGDGEVDDMLREVIMISRPTLSCRCHLLLTKRHCFTNVYLAVSVG